MFLKVMPLSALILTVSCTVQKNKSNPSDVIVRNGNTTFLYSVIGEGQDSQVQRAFCEDGLAIDKLTPEDCTTQVNVAPLNDFKVALEEFMYTTGAPYLETLLVNMKEDLIYIQADLEAATSSKERLELEREIKELESLTEEYKRSLAYTKESQKNLERVIGLIKEKKVHSFDLAKVRYDSDIRLPLFYVTRAFQAVTKPVVSESAPDEKLLPWSRVGGSTSIEFDVIPEVSTQIQDQQNLCWSQGKSELGSVLDIYNATKSASNMKCCFIGSKSDWPAKQSTQYYFKDEPKCSPKGSCFRADSLPTSDEDRKRIHSFVCRSSLPADTVSFGEFRNALGASIKEWGLAL